MTGWVQASAGGTRGELPSTAPARAALQERRRKCIHFCFPLSGTSLLHPLLHHTHKRRLAGHGTGTDLPPSGPGARRPPQQQRRRPGAL
ncbi:hypothetical protein FKM82_016561 [Ascaphus truei]